MKLKIGIVGAAGRMGKALLEVCEEDKEVEIKGIVEKEGVDFKYRDLKLSYDVREISPLCDVIIEFTDPSATYENTMKLIEKPCSYVVGTTALSENNFSLFKKLSEKVPVFYSPNMSLGVHIIGGFIRKFSSFLKEFELEIMERHHNRKKDSPSGTAFYFFNTWKENVDKTAKEVLGERGKKEKGEVGIFGIRQGNIPGEHNLYFTKEDEEIVITHRVYSRKVFAKGAVFIAKKITALEPGFYTFEYII
jgi:4-hydroxy-tetrahydrodipicolinate reductase